MNKDFSQNLILRITEYGLQHQRFTLVKLQTDLKMSKEDFEFLRATLVSHNHHSDNPNHILAISEAAFNQLGQPHIPNSKYSLLPNALFNYIDYVEIVEAKKQAKEATNQATIALTVAVYTLIISVILGLAQMFFSVLQMFKS